MWTSCFLEYGCYGAEVAGKAKCPGNSGRVRRNHFLAICIFLLFIGWQNFYVENSLTRALAKVGKDYSMLIYVLHYAVLQALSRCFKGRRSLLAKGYHQYGMMFVFAVTVVMVAVYANARACLKNHSRKL